MRRERKYPGRSVCGRNIKTGQYNCSWAGRNEDDQLPKNPKKVQTKQQEESGWLLPAAVPVGWRLGWREGDWKFGLLSYCLKEEGLLYAF